MRRRWKVLFLALAALAVLVWLGLFLTVGGDYYRTVDEVRRDGASGTVRVGGRVAPGSIVQQGEVVRFAIEGSGGTKLSVVYSGPYPERLGPYEQIVALGSLGEKGQLLATQVLVKCPSKMLPERASGSLIETLGLRRLLYN